jgi:inhibitor of KinA sporulation pathway (predicted exonuclease)
MLANVLVIDLEATCADDNTIPAERMEVLEVGAAYVSPSGEILDRFHSFVRPIERPQLNDFCKRLLPHIDQATIDAAPTWPAVAAKLAEFAQRHQQPGSWWTSYGAFDFNQVVRECARHGIADPLALPHQNLKSAFAKARKIKQVGMTTALQIVGLALEGEHHRALDDALNIARLLPYCPRLAPETEG